jgi:hypothetical protein
MNDQFLDNEGMNRDEEEEEVRSFFIAIHFIFALIYCCSPNFFTNAFQTLLEEVLANCQCR